MLNGFLKSSVSALVLLSIAANLTPSQAMDGEPKKEKSTLSLKRKKKKTPVNLQDFSAGNDTEVNNPQVIKSKEDYAEAKKHNESKSAFGGMSGELTLFTLMHLDPLKTLKVQLVCTDWNQLISSRKQFLMGELNKFNSDEEVKNISSQLVRLCLFHPTTSIMIHDKLSSLYANQVIRPRIDQKIIKQNIDQNTTEQDSYPVPMIIETYASMIDELTDHHPFFSKMCLQLDPHKNFKPMFLVSYTTQHSKNLQDIFFRISKGTLFKMKKFPELIKTSENFPMLKQHLLALRYLSLSENEFAKTRMKDFLKTFNNYLNENLRYLLATGEGIISVQKLLPNLLRENPFFITQPLWSYYAYGNVFLSKQLRLIEYISNTTFAENLDLETIENFINYCSFLTPHGSSSLDLQNLNDKLLRIRSNVFKAQKDLLKQRKHLEEIHSSLDQRNLDAVVHNSIKYMRNGDYAKAWEILNNAHQKVDDSPFRFQIFFQMGKCILLCQDKEKFAQAEEYIEILLREIEAHDSKEITTPFHLTVGEGEDQQNILASTYKDTHGVNGVQVQSLKLALLISQGEFEEASQNYQLLTKIDFKRGFLFGDHGDVILAALQAQYSSMESIPKNLMKFLRKDVENNFSISYFKTPHGQTYLSKYGDVIHYLLQKKLKLHPIDKKNFEKLREEVLRSDQPAIEEKEEELSVAPKKALSVSAQKDERDNKGKKDKKDKKDKS